MKNNAKCLKKKLAKVQQRKQRLNWVELRIKHRKNLSAYSASLVARLHEAAYLPRVEMQGGNWQPQPNMCHHNVTEYCQLDRRFSPVRGWLFFDLPYENYYKFVAHSVLKFPDGSIMDITPSNAGAEYPFLACNVSNRDFAAIATVCENGELNVPK